YHPAEAVDPVKDDNGEGTVAPLPCEAALIGHGTVAAAHPRLQRSALAWPPQHADIPHDAIEIIEQRTGRTLVRHEAAVGNDRDAIRVQQRRTLADGDIFI